MCIRDSHGLELYGNAIIVNTDFAADNPDIVNGFLKAVVNGRKHVIADPIGGAEMIAKRNPAAGVALESRRLQLAIDGNVLTDYVKANGMGGIEAARFDRSLTQLQENFEFDHPVEARLYFTNAHRSDSSERMLQ